MRRILSLFFLTALFFGTLSAQVTVQGQPYPMAKRALSEAETQFRSDANFTFDNIRFWVGSGSKKAALVIEWHDGKSPDALVWGYRWDGEANGHDMIVAIAKADPRLVLLTQHTGWMGYTIGGVGYSEQTLNITYDLESARTDPKNAFEFESPITNPLLGQTGFPSAPAADVANAIREGVGSGVIYHPFNAQRYGYPSYDYDHWLCNTGGHWKAGWYKGYWSYFIKDSQTGTFSYSGLGSTSRQLTDGSWDAWSWNGNMETSSGTSPGSFFTAAPAPADIPTPPDPDPAVGVTGVTLNTSTLRLQVGLTATLAATITPVNADNKSISWTTSNREVATVSNGVVTAIKAGTARISVTTASGNHTASCDVTVAEPVVPELTYNGSAVVLSFPKSAEATSYEIRVYQTKDNKPVLHSTYVTDANGNIVTELRMLAIRPLSAAGLISVPLTKINPAGVYSLEIRVMKGLDIVDTYRGSYAGTVGNDLVTSDNRRAFYANKTLHLVDLAGYRLYLFDISGRLKETLQVINPTEAHPLSLSPGVYILAGKSSNGNVSIKFQVAY